MKARNKVISGAYENKFIVSDSRDKIWIILGFTKKIEICRDSIEKYELISQDVSYKKGFYLVSLEFKNNERSLIEIDGNIYRALVKSMFDSKISTQTNCQNTNSYLHKKNKNTLGFVFFLLIIFAVIIAIGNSSEKQSTFQEITGITPQQEKEIFKILNECGIESIETIKHDESLDGFDSETEKGYRISTKGINNIIIYIDNGNLKTVRYIGENLYKNGEIIAKITDYALTDDQKMDIRFNAEKWIKSTLKSPSTAKFPTSMKEWEIWKENGLIIVRSYVDAQNSFGAMIRSQFQLSIKDGKIISYILDGEEKIK